MITFFEGPAAGRTLALRRAPLWLRVVVDEETGAVDALDQPGDLMRDAETAYVYTRLAPPSSGFVCKRGKGGGCRHVLQADYRYHPDQPDQAVLQDNEAWARWATQQATKGTP